MVPVFIREKSSNKHCIIMQRRSFLPIIIPPALPNPASQADKQITDKLKQALTLFDIRVLDHFIIGDGEPYSFAEHGLL